MVPKSICDFSSKDSMLFHVILHEEGFALLVKLQDLIMHALGLIPPNYYMMYSSDLSRTLQWDTDPLALQLLADSVHG